MPAAKAEAATVPDPPPAVPGTRLAWVVVYPKIHVVPKDEQGKIIGDAITLTEGQTLPATCEWNAELLKVLGHVTALSVPA